MPVLGLAAGLAVLASHVPASLVLAQTTPAAPAMPLLAHRASYMLGLDASKPSVKLESANGRIDYEIKGDACKGYDVKLHQANEVDTGEGATAKSDMLSTSWEDGDGKSYRFQTVNRTGSRVSSDVAATVNRVPDGLSIDVTKPRRELLELKGQILLPTQHVMKVLDAARRNETTLEARVFDGSDDGDKVYDTLAVIGQGTKDARNLPDAAKLVLSGITYYPVSVSYFDAGSDSQTPAYVMSMTLYENGVIGDMKIDYNDFILRGRIETLETLPASEGCQR
ncbi:cell envelope integrity EipB family protein [Aquabacter cavernae]|uniref:cell envelope integrity EipB family protein n=1 Tax=Aquabacter cavernae TaxID=2496029 RepID=UPI0013DF736A|nr:cell envelope integrity EipB family protein [Aquabacter cavernae]